MRKTLRYLVNHIEELVTLFFFSVMCVFVFLQILFRYLFKNPLIFTEEISCFSYVWVTFIGLSLATKLRNHVKIDFFVTQLPRNLSLFFRFVVDIGSELLLIYLCIWGIRYTIFNSMITSPALEITMIVVYIALPLGTALASLRLIKMIWEDIKLYRLSENNLQ